MIITVAEMDSLTNAHHYQFMCFNRVFFRCCLLVYFCDAKFTNHDLKQHIGEELRILITSMVALNNFSENICNFTVRSTAVYFYQGEYIDVTLD